MHPRPPPTVVTAAVVAALQAVFLLGYAVLEIVHASGGSATVAVTTSLFFAAYALALLWCVRGLLRLSSWSRGPVLVTELISLLLAYDFRGGDTTPVALALLVLAAVGLGCLLHPVTTEALNPD